MKFYKRFFKEPKSSFFLFGPRGTGKSTLMGKHFRNSLWIDLLNPEQLLLYSGYPERLRELIEGNPDKDTIVIDEVQRIPSLLSVVHQIIEEKRNKQFILTGSSSRKLKRTGADLLGGRALKCTLHPFMAAELGSHFSLSHALKYGLIPLVNDAEHPQKTLQAYIGLYLQEEIQTEGLVRNLESFSRFLEAISFSHGSLLNITNVGRECGVKRKTVENYIEILEELLLGFQLQVFTKRAKRGLSAQPKFYLFDAGVFRTLRPKGLLDISDEIDGLALEGLVAQHLMAWKDYSEEKYDVYFWRTRSGLEVDFIVYGADCFCALEVKNSSRVFPQDIKPLEAFLDDYPMAQGILLYRGKEKLKIKNIHCIPIDQFLPTIIPNKHFLSE